MPASIIPVTGLVLGPIGSISQTDFPITSPRLINLSDTKVPSFGDTVVLNANNTYSSVAQFIANAGTLTATTPIGFAQATVKTNSSYPTNGSGSIAASGTYPAGSEADVLSRGTINVAINHGTPTGAGEAVFVRIILNGAIPAGVIGGIEGVADGINTVQLTNGVVFKTGIVSTDPGTGLNTVQVTILNRLIP